MATKGEKYERLHDFFLQSFEPPELKMFLRKQDYNRVADAVNPNAGADQYFFDVIEALDRRGLIDAEFFDRLVEERNKKMEEIKRLRADWVGKNAEQEKWAAQVKE